MQQMNNDSVSSLDFLRSYVKKNDEISVYLLNGVCLKGEVISIHMGGLVIKGLKGSQLIFPHAISTISLNAE